MSNDHANPGNEASGAPQHQGLEVRCPHCHNTVRVAEDDPLTQITCPSCGSSFHLISGQVTESYAGIESRTIGHFELLEPVGQGRMGAVWKSLDTELDRIVAIKIPRKERLAAEEAEQFLREARAAAQLSHPNIVPVHEVGVEGDTVYIVSDYVDGLTLADWLTGQKPTVREAVELCAKVADALHHAHESGVVHRDLKPLNIMLEPGGEPRITDFGLARRETGEITMTVAGKVLGTPAYMSPEQARGEAHHADRRTDVYSLGVTLFELLTGERPFRGNVRMLLHQVIHDDAPSPRRLNARIPRDLETVCLKCLEKKPERRYQTAAAVAADLRHWLNKEPIQARPVTRLQRVVRWCQRRPAIAAMVGLVVLVASLGFAGVTWQWREAEIARVQAQGNLDKALDAVDRMLTRVGRERLADVPQMEEVRREVLLDAASMCDSLLKRAVGGNRAEAHTARVYSLLGDANTMLARLGEAEDAYRRAIALFRKLVVRCPNEAAYSAGLARVCYGLGTVCRNAGRGPEADRLCQEAVHFQERLVHELSGQVTFKEDLIDMYEGLGKYYIELGRTDHAEEYCRKGLVLCNTLSSQAPGSSEYLERVARIHLLLGRIHLARDHGPEVEGAFRESLDAYQRLVEGDPSNSAYREGFAQAYRSLGMFLLGKETQRVESYNEGQRALRESVRILEQLAREFPNMPRFQSELAKSYAGIAGRFPTDPGLAFRLKALEIRERLARTFPDTLSYQVDLAETYQDTGRLLVQKESVSDAESFYCKAVDVWEVLSVRESAAKTHLNRMAEAYSALGGLMEKKGDLEGAEDLFCKATEAYATIEGSGDSEYNMLLCRERLGHVLNRADKPLAAASAFRANVDLLAERLAPGSEKSARPLVLTYNLHALGTTLFTLGKYDEAESVLRQAIDLKTKFLRNTGSPGAARFAHVRPGETRPEIFLWSLESDVAAYHRSLGQVLKVVQRESEAAEAYRQAIDVLESLVSQSPQNDSYRYSLAQDNWNLGTLLAFSLNERHEEAREAFLRSGELGQELVADHPDEVSYRVLLSSTFNCLGWVLANRLERKEEAEAAFRNGVEVLEAVPPGSLTEPAKNAFGHLYHNLGCVLEEMGRASEARDSFRLAVDVRLGLLAESSNAPLRQDDLAASCQRFGRFVAAGAPASNGGDVRDEIMPLWDKHLTGSPASPPEQMAWSGAYGQLASLLEKMGRVEEAGEAYRKSIGFAELAVSNDLDPSSRSTLAGYFHKWGLGLLTKQKNEEAEKLLRKGAQMRESLLSEFTESSEYRSDLGTSYIYLGIALFHTDRAEESVELLQKSLTLWDGLLAEAPTELARRQGSANCLGWLAEAQRSLEQHTAADESRQRSIRVRQEIVTEFPDNLPNRTMLAWDYFALAGDLEKRIRSLSEAEETYRQAIGVLEEKDLAQVLEQGGAWPNDRLAQVYSALGNNLVQAERSAEAEEAYRHAISIWEKHLDGVSTAYGFHANLADTYGALAWLLITREDAKPPYEEAIEYAEKAVNLAPEAGGHFRPFAVARYRAGSHWRTLAVGRYRAADWDEAREALEKAMEFYTTGDGITQFFLAMTCWRQGNKDEARSWFDKAVKWMDQNDPDNHKLQRVRQEAAELLGIDSENNPE